MEAHGAFVVLGNGKLRFVKSITTNGSSTPKVNADDLRGVSGYFHTHNLHPSNDHHYFDFKERDTQNNLVRLIPPSSTDILTQCKMCSVHKNIVSVIVTARGIFVIRPVTTQVYRHQLDAVYYQKVLGLPGQVDRITPAVTKQIAEHCKKNSRQKRLWAYQEAMRELGVTIDWYSWYILEKNKSHFIEFKKYTNTKFLKSNT